MPSSLHPVQCTVSAAARPNEGQTVSADSEERRPLSGQPSFTRLTSPSWICFLSCLALRLFVESRFYSFINAQLTISISRLMLCFLSFLGARGRLTIGRSHQDNSPVLTSNLRPSDSEFLNWLNFVHFELSLRWRTAGAGHVAPRRPQLFAHVFTFWDPVAKELP